MNYPNNGDHATALFNVLFAIMGKGQAGATQQEIIDLINKRLTLVDKLWRYKAEHGIEMYNPEREEWMVTFLTRANKGPLSQEALTQVYKAIVETTKDEAARLGRS